ncbi:hypothetical protein [Methylobacterium symbioticum]|uniref:Uncharacterized protein n=1 Tax=Methylobacterium symbioticum TaxID=2584084 RepID=A0A509E649_9HYPH|nr:hypothetical protein [Methylobacterium symbioticum]VUD69651.1 hypothetical protein MET9862_00206 [Methylobacterium symbioticum]
MRRTNDRRQETYVIETLSYSPTRLVRLGRRKVAMLFQPAEPGAPWQLYPHPDAFPGLTFEGLPAPLRPEFMSFSDLGAVEDFLGLRKAPKAEPMALAA